MGAIALAAAIGFGAAPAMANIASITPASFTPETSVDYGYIHGDFTVTDSGADVLNVYAGQTFTVSGTWSTTTTNTSYCPGCIFQFYVAGLSPLSGQANLLSGGYGHTTGSGDYSITFTAPTAAGTYYVGGASIADYNFISGVSGSASGAGDVSYQINVSAVPELSTWAMMLIGFAGFGFAAYRRGKGERLGAAA